MKEKTSSIDTLFIIMLLCAFAASVLMVLLLGARVYGSMTRSSGENYDRRTCAAYISEKLRHGDSLGAVKTGEFDSCSALYLYSEGGGSEYSDILYYYDGWLWELNCDKGAVFTRTDGVQVVETDPVSFSGPEDGIVTAAISGEDGAAERIRYCLRSGGAA